jgi:hypothetical protein
LCVGFEEIIFCWRVEIALRLFFLIKESFLLWAVIKGYPSVIF